MSISLATQECVYLLPVVQNLGLDVGGPVFLHGDNHGAIKLAENLISNSRSKNDIRHHLIRVLVKGLRKTTLQNFLRKV